MSPPSVMEHSSTDEIPLKGVAAGFVGAAERGREAIMRGVFGAARARRVVIGDRYRLESVLGSGGQGVVWRASDLRLARDVAVKLMRLGGSVSTQAQTWLRREANLLSRFAHPHVVTVFDLGMCTSPFEYEQEHEVVFVVIELVDGTPLDQWVATHHPDRDELLRLLAQVASGIDAVHEGGLVHRDIKPANILVGRAGVKLADFGLAHAARMLGEVDELDGAEALIPDTTNSPTIRASPFTTGSRPTIAGTPLYMPPEQFREGRLAPRADVYALAATIFEVLFGRPPHRAPTTAELFALKRTGAPEKPNGTDLPRAAYAELARSLAADPNERHASASQLVESIAAALRHSRVRGRVVGAMSVGLLGAAIALGSSDCPRPRGDAPVTAELRERLVPDAGSAGERAMRVLEQRERELERVQGLACTAAAPSTTATTCVQRLERSFAAATTQLRELDSRQLHRVASIVDQVLVAADCERDDANAAASPDASEEQHILAQLDLAKIAWSAGDVQTSIETLDEVLATAAEGSARARTELYRARILADIGRGAEAERELEASFERATRDDDPRHAAEVATELAGLTRRREAFDQATQWVRHARAAIARVDEAAELSCELDNTRGWIALDLQDLSAAQAAFEEALESCAAAGDDTDGLAAIRSHLAMAKLHAGDRDDAVALMEAAHAEIVSVRGENHPHAIDSLANLGHMLGRVGRLDEARDALEQALAMREDAYGADVLSHVQLLDMLIAVLAEQADYAAATSVQRRIEAIEDRWLAPDDPQRARTKINAIALALDRGDVTGAAETIDRARANLEPNLAPQHPFHIALLLQRARLARMQLDPSLEIDLLEETVLLIERWDARNHEMLATAFIALAEAGATGERPELTREYVAAARALPLTTEQRARVDRLDRP